MQFNLSRFASRNWRHEYAIEGIRIYAGQTQGMSPDKLLFKRLAANGRPIFAAQPHHTYQMAEGRRNDQQRDSSSGQSQVFMSETETQSSDAPVEKFIVSAPSAVQPVSSQSQSSSSGMSSDCYSSPLFVPRGRAYAFGASSNHKRRKVRISTK